MTTVMDNFNSNKQSEVPISEIQSFYNDQTILLTGGTGFMGNLILEKLIRWEFFATVLQLNII